MKLTLNVRYYMAEFYGTFMMFFLGVGSLYLTGNPVIAALVFGGSYLVAAMTLQHISSAHFNPVITLAALIDKRLPINRVWIYLAGQVTGALFGVLSLLLFEGVNQAMIRYDLFSFRTYVLEIFFAFIVTYVYLAVSEQPERRPFLGLAVGLSYTLVLIVSTGMIEGGFVHPLRFIETFIFDGTFPVLALLLVWFSLEIGGLLAALFYKYLKYKNTPDNR